MWSLKPQQWGSLLVQEKYQEEKFCDKRHLYHTTTIIIIIIIIIIITVIIILIAIIVVVDVVVVVNYRLYVGNLPLHN